MASPGVRSSSRGPTGAREATVGGRVKRLGIVAAMALSVSACSGSSSPFADSCVAKVRYAGNLYVEVGFSSRDVKPAGKAAIATCAADPESKQVDAVSFPGYSSSKVVAVRQHGDTYRVFVEESLGDAYIMSPHDARLLNAGDQ